MRFRNTDRFTWTAIAVAVVCLAVPATGEAQCRGLFYADLVSGQIANFAPGTFGDVATAANPDPECPTRLLKLRVDVPEACLRAVVWVQFEGQPTGWALNVGDSPTNNGFGGDAGTVPGNAELQVLDDSLSVYSSATSPEDLDRLAFQHLGLTDGALNLVVADQSLSWGQPYSLLETPNVPRLFAIPDAEGDGRSFYVGLNRVVGNTSRVGCGARRVLISFED
jgi:hypothetical protein